jgi:hypothetical protein
MNKQSSNILEIENLKLCNKSSINNEMSSVKKTTPLISTDQKDNYSKENLIKNADNKRKSSIIRSLTFKAKNSRLTRLNSLHVIRILKKRN